MLCFEASPDLRFATGPSHTGLIRSLLTSSKADKPFCFVSPLLVAVNYFHKGFIFYSLQILEHAIYVTKVAFVQGVWSQNFRYDAESV